jgi:pyruvate formate lyase activating enzyme
LIRARNIAINAGLHFVYTGNVHHREGDTTYCPHCHATLIERDWYQIKQYRLASDGHCPDCGVALPGRFAEKAGNFGRKRVPIAIGA